MSRQKVKLDQLIVPAGTPDGYAPAVAGGELVLSQSDPSAPNTITVPLTSTVAGEPVLVWESDDSLALTEVPL